MGPVLGTPQLLARHCGWKEACLPAAFCSSPECVEGEFSEVSLKSKDWNFLRSRPSISAMLGMYVKWTTRRQVGCLTIS
jgi:hypothetical protein